MEYDLMEFRHTRSIAPNHGRRNTTISYYSTMSEDSEERSSRPGLVGWPGVIPHPGVRRTPLRWELGDDGVLVSPIDWFVLTAHGDPPVLEAPRIALPRGGRRLHAEGDEAQDRWRVGELYLELAELDLADDNAIAAFVAKFGPLGVAFRRFELVRELPGLYEHIVPELAQSWPYEDLGQTVDDYCMHRGQGGNSNLVETLDEFRFGARVLRDLNTAAQIATTDQRPDAPAWQSIPSNVLTTFLDDLRDWGVELDVTDQAVEIMLQRVLSDGLLPFHPRVGYGGTPRQAADLPLYAICCLEIFNHFVEHAEHRICANETCQRRFVRQQGRAEHGQHRRSGIKYCSMHCARAQAQRAHRRRTRQQPKQPAKSSARARRPS
jgi:hypothetical protein